MSAVSRPKNAIIPLQVTSRLLPSGGEWLQDGGVWVKICLWTKKTIVVIMLNSHISCMKFCDFILVLECFLVVVYVFSSCFEL